MPNRIDANINGIRPSLAVREDRQANNQAAGQESPQPEQQADRVDISEQARLRVEQTRPRAGSAQANPRRVNAPSDRPPQAGEQGGVTGTTAAQAEELRARQDAAVRESAERPRERPGNLVDVVG